MLICELKPVSLMCSFPRSGAATGDTAVQKEDQTTASQVCWEAIYTVHLARSFCCRIILCIYEKKPVLAPRSISKILLYKHNETDCVLKITLHQFGGLTHAAEISEQIYKTSHLYTISTSIYSQCSYTEVEKFVEIHKPGCFLCSEFACSQASNGLLSHPE